MRRNSLADSLFTVANCKLYLAAAFCANLYTVIMNLCDNL